MTGSILTSGAEQYQSLWRDYWGTRWHHPVMWPSHRLACLLTAERARQDSNATGDALVSDFPRGKRPLLGVLTNSLFGDVSSQSGVLEYNQDGHLLTIAPTRAGKGASQIIPNLMLYAGSTLVVDIKGENYDITHKHRATFFEGADVHKFAPFDEHTSRYNPLDFIRVNEDGSSSSFTFDDARLLAEMLVGNRFNETFWDIEARGIVTMLLIYVATEHRPGSHDRVMKTVIERLFPEPLPDEKTLPFDRTIRDIQLASELNDDRVLASLVTQFLEHEDKVRAGILSTCRSAMSIWLSPRLQDATAASDFRFLDLKKSMCRPEADNPAPTTLYLIIPPEYLREYRPVLRMMVGLAALELTRAHAWATPENLDAGWQPKPPCPVLFLLDEFPSLGYMAPIEQGVAYLAGYGVQIWTFAQSLGQLKDIYKENWTTFVSNAGAACYFGMSDPDICDFLAQQLGKTGEYSMRYYTTAETEGSSYGSSDSKSWNRSVSYGSYDSTGGSGHSSSTSDSSSHTDSSSTTITEQIRFKDDPVATASDIRAMPQNSQLILMRHKPPAIASLLNFYECELFSTLYGSWRS